MTGYQPRTQDRIAPAIAAIAVQGSLLYALILGLAVHFHIPQSDDLALFGIAADPPPPPAVKIIPERVRSKRPEGAASPPNLRSAATEIEAPPPIIPLAIPPPVVTAPTPAASTDATSGAATIAGPGTGSGGIGNGTGSGGNGDGDGGGGSGADETPPRHLKGSLKDSDYPGGLSDAGISGTVGVRYFVEVNGRVTNCEVTRSSGNAELDATTCRLIEQRFRYAPSRDAHGRPVPSMIVESHSWLVEEESAPAT